MKGTVTSDSTCVAFDEKGVGGVLVGRFDPQELLYHHLHLGLGGPAEAHHRFFHHQGGVMEDGHQ